MNPRAAAYVPRERTFTNVTQNVYVALRTLPVIISANGKELKVNALLDDGSTRTYLNQDVAEELGLRNTFESVTVTTLNGRSENISTMNVKIDIKSMDKSTEMTIEANTTKDVTGNLKPIDWKVYSKKLPHLNGLNFPHISKKQKVDLLIGLDYSDLHLSLGELTGEEGSPTARLTPLGWTCVGPIGRKEPNTCMFTFHADEQTSDVNEVLRKFWEIESVETVNKVMSPDDMKVLDTMNGGIHYDDQKHRYSDPVPWIGNKMELKNNYEMANRRLESIERKLNRDLTLKSTYRETIEKYEKKGYVSKVSNVEKKSKSEESQWFMPHFPVIKLDRATIKVRMVFDASAKSNGVSLNDVIYQGPKLQNDLFDVLLRFRKHQVAVVCDIEEMYLQVGLFQSDRRYHRFLWCDDCSHDPDIYAFNRVVFGVNASPFLAQYVSQENARRFQDLYPMAAESVIKSTYMDDTIDSVQSVEHGVALYQELWSLWNKAGMRPHKWLSNSEKVLANIPQKDKASQVDIGKEELPCIKTLGLNWVSESDMFKYAYNLPIIEKLTKRTVLKKIAALFDPLGFLVPYTVRAKIILQDLWLLGLDWDDTIPEDLEQKVKQCLSELTDLKEVQVPRCLNVTEVHTFVDASDKAYAAVVYHKQGQETQIIASKGRVAPLKQHSIPRLELMAAIIGLTLTITVCSALGIPLKKATFWIDSMNVLHWIHSNNGRQYKTFVANRIGTIHQNQNPSQWRYVPTKENSADVASRGETMAKLARDELWWHGPEFLKSDSKSWPELKLKFNDGAKVEMKRISMTKTFLVVNSEDENFRLKPENFSNWNRYVPVTAWVNRFLDNCQASSHERRLSRELSVQEIQQAETRIIVKVQANAFKNEYECLKQGKPILLKSVLAPMKPRLDSEEVMRSDSRLKYADSLPYNARFPVLLPRKNSVTKLIVKNCHEKTCHGGTNATLAELFSHFWVVSAREEIRDWERCCAKCKILKAKASNQIMGSLPDERLATSTKAFTKTAGPLITKQGRGKTRLKRYLCVFTCMSTRAIHLEVANSMDTSSFINALSRFTSRRGIPKTIVSDNGTNFVGCARELKDLYNTLDQDKIMRKMALQRIDWKFIPPNAPHFGGVHESMVKCAKKALFRILGNADITDEELITAVTSAEALVNSRPLTYQTSDPSDNLVLTPNHFLIGQMGGHFAPELPSGDQHDVRKRWRRIQELLRHFWNRWLREYITTLGSRSKLHRDCRDFKVNDIVLIIETDTPRGQWPLGRIVQVHPGPDGHVRVVDLQTAKSVIKMPVTRISLVTESAD